MPAYFQFKVQLLDVEPAIWRRFLIRPEATFAEMHRAIQMACGWQNCHLYCFFAERPWQDAVAGIPDDEEFDNFKIPDARQVELLEYFGAHGSKRCLYVYDFGDSWCHEVLFEGDCRLPEVFRRRLLGGGRAFPPEDSGGVSSYDDWVALVRGPKPTRGESLERLEWLGDWDPERFDLKKVAKKFERTARASRRL